MTQNQYANNSIAEGKNPRLHWYKLGTRKAKEKLVKKRSLIEWKRLHYL